MHGIRKALDKAISNGLCDVEVRASATVGDILDVFQNPNLGPRISIFHYGGHANGFSLLLEAMDGTQVQTHKDGLVPFMARQPNLKLIFLNGCSSDEQATDLLKAGIPAVIGTTASINDEIATALAIRFYSSLGDGAGIEKAWTDATDEVKIIKGAGATRALLWEGKKDVVDRFPWVIQFKPGSDIIKEWNLPDISGNPLYGLPDIPATHNLPESPFLYLNRYERKHAEVYFGRSFYIRSLYATIVDKEAPPIILMYGQSGVGKSSLLDAGLLPRLETSHLIIYLRRNGILGLSATLYNALLEMNGFKSLADVPIRKQKNDTTNIIETLGHLAVKLETNLKRELELIIQKIAESVSSQPSQTPLDDKIAPQDIASAWRLLEQTSKKPLLVVLDQVEEAYTRPNENLKNEVAQLFIDLKTMFGSVSTHPRGKIILSFRKEYHPELEEYCKMYELPRAKVFIEHITKKDVLDVFKGFKETPKLQARYNVNIEDGLPEIVAADLAADDDAPIAPMLQILLTKIWNKSIFTSPSDPAFTHKLYNELKEEGLAMDEFLHNQIVSIKKRLPALYQNGFVLDVLAFYCTANNTSAAKSEKQLHAQFPFAIKEADEVVTASKDLFLITDLGSNEKLAMLAHDTLAKSVLKAHQRSALALQQAQRVLHSRLEAIRAGSDMATLDVWDLKLLDKVQHYLPAYSDEIKKLMETSRHEIKRKENEKKLLAIFKWAVVTISVVGVITIAYLFRQSMRNAKDLFVNHMAASSANILNTDPTQGLKLALMGMDIKEEYSIAEIKKALTHAYYRSKDSNFPWYTQLYTSDINFHSLLVNEQSKRIIPFAELSTLKVLDYDGQIKGNLTVKADSGYSDLEEFMFFDEVKWSTDGKYILAKNTAGVVQIHDQNGIFIRNVSNEQLILEYAVSPRSNQFCTFSVDSIVGVRRGLIHLYELSGTLIDTILVTPDINYMHYNFDGTGLIFIVAPSAIDQPESSNVQLDCEQCDNIGLLDLTHKQIKLLDANEANIDFMFYSNSGKILIAQHKNDVLVIWNEAGKLLDKIKPPTEYEAGAEFQDGGYVLAATHPNDSLVAYTHQRGRITLRNIYGKKISLEIKHDQLITFLQFSIDGHYLLAGSDDNTAIGWDLKGNKKFTLLGHTNDVTAGFFADHNTIITTSLDGSVKHWTLSESIYHSLIGHQGAVTYIDVDSTGKYLVSSGMDQTMRLWDLDTRKELDQVDFSKNRMGVRYATFLNEREILGITWNNQAFIYTILSKQLMFCVGHEGLIEWASNIGEVIITAARDGAIKYWNKSGVELHSVVPSQSELLSLDVSPVDSLIAVGDNDGIIYFYNVHGQQLNRIQEHTRAVIYLDFSDDGKYLVSASQDGTAMIWDIVNMKLKARLDRIICAPYNDCTLISANFNTSSTEVVTTSSDRTIRLWDLEGNFKTQLVGHTDKIIDAFYAPNDQVVYSYSEDKTLRLWDVNGKEITTYAGHTGKINCAYMTNDMNHIYSAADDGIIRHWLTPTGVYRRLKSQPEFISRSIKGSK